ncbi:hypothetical protein Sjap_009450 [Stephania japonica]|uniref:Uncharacterized protein n=1 Tax=Stephania japonica TaxID=461633 RepID=A0AAP0JS12_9MAGN
MSIVGRSLLALASQGNTMDKVDSIILRNLNRIVNVYMEDKVQWAFPPDVHAQIFFDPHDQGIQSDTTVLIQDVDATTDTGFIPSDNDVEIGSS